MADAQTLCCQNDWRPDRSGVLDHESVRMRWQNVAGSYKWKKKKNRACNGEGEV